MNTDFLKYDASSLVEYLRRRLLESGVYTDQIYPGSDTKLLMDLFAWTFGCLQYILNENASNILFSDSALYENMNKMVKLLSYNPKAYITSNSEFSIDGTFDQSISKNITIPRYAKIETDKTDSDGNTVCYSFIEDYTFTIKNGNIVHRNDNPILYNGEFVKYSFDYAAAGTKFETFVMTNIGPNSDSNKCSIDNNSLAVYIEKVNDSTGVQEYEEAKIVNSLVLDSTSTDLVCEARLNDNKEFEFRFGDGIHGKMLDEGSRIHIIYLKSNKESGKIQANEVSTDSLRLNVKGFTDNTTFINMLYGGSNNFRLLYGNSFTNGNSIIYNCTDFTFTNVDESSNVIDYEDVEEIREYAPDSFRIGNRLVTANDYRTYILNTYPNRVTDAYVCNNNEYCTVFYKWLEKHDKLDINIRLDSYEYADACDFNNIYLWLKPNGKQNVMNYDKETIIKGCNNIKSLTTNLIPLNGIKVYFMPYLDTEPEDEMMSSSYEPPLKIVVKKLNTYLSDESIKNNIVEIISNYFKNNSKFGATINITDIYQEIIALGYIDSIKTESKKYSKSYRNYVNGLSFCSFTNDIINMNDFNISNHVFTLEKFQYPVLLNESTLINLIEITNEDSFTLKNDEI